MRATTTLAASTLLFAASSAYLYVQQSKTRSDLGQREPNACASQEAELASLVRQRDALLRKLERARSGAAVFSSAAPAAMEALGRSSPIHPPRATSGPPPSSALSRLPDPPPGVLRLMMVRMYGELARELRLSPAETDQLMDLLVDHEQLRRASRSDELGSGEQLAAELERGEREREGAVADLLGEERAAQYRAYQKSIGERAELRMLSEHLDVLGVPLDREQHSKVLAIMVEERERSPKPPLSPGEYSEEAYRQWLAWRQESQRRIRERAGSVLSPDQRERLDEYFELQPPLPVGPPRGTVPAGPAKPAR